MSKKLKTKIKVLGVKGLLRALVSDFYKAPPGYFAKVTIVDRIFEKTILKIIPNSIIPNHLTVARYLSIPFVIYFLWNDYVWSGGILFAISALTDALDGALARTRNKITYWGIINDPLADKLLIGSSAMILVTKYISFNLAFVIVGIELLIILYALYKSSRHKIDIVQAKLVGKIKMILQSIGLFFLVVYAITGIFWILPMVTYILYASVVFALLSLFVYKSI